jgi:preprotein translocase subunit SecA
MLKKLAKIVNSNEREIKKLQKTVDKINSLEQEVSSLSLNDLRKKTIEFKKRLKDGETLDDLLIESFAVVREVAKRTIKMRHFDVQIMGGIILHQGRTAEMKTGEGKTLAATLPLYLNALEGKGCHLITVNDYLAKRDALWMGPVYLELGLSVGTIEHGEELISHYLDKEDDKYVLKECSRREAYLCDITYGTNNEFGFDYLRDNMVVDLSDMVQRELNYAIVDEVDSILIDEARTPLIISGIAEKPTELYFKFARVIPRLKKEEDYTVDEKAHSATFTDKGVAKVEQIMGINNLMEPENIHLLHHANCALRANTLMKKEVDYMVKDGQVIIIDEFTGRLMYGRRFSEGLHQAIEAKEGVKIEHESQTLATITFQNYFRLYKKLAGMTGTAKTEEREFREIYGMDVVVIPTHKPMIRKDAPDVIYKTEKGKFKAIVDEILNCHKRGQPVLVGTRSVEKSEELSRTLHKRGIVRINWKEYSEEKLEKLKDVHFVLNAKEHEHEAKIIARAGKKGAVTIATNMAGRGVDIVLEEGVVEVGGLHIIGTERHESRRIDNQLRGRSGRQGDPGSSRFYVSLEDELMRLFGGERVKNLMERIGFEDDTPIENKFITKQIENAQGKVEMRNFSIRKSVLEYDDVMEVQRKIIYSERKKILSGADLKKNILEFLEKSIERIVNKYCLPDFPKEQWDLRALKTEFKELVPISSKELKLQDIKNKEPEEIKEILFSLSKKTYDEREKELSEEEMRNMERGVMLRVMDEKWIEHLDAMDYLREGINLRAYAQTSPINAYQKEAYAMFQQLLDNIQEDVVKYILRIQAVALEEVRYRATHFGKSKEMETVSVSSPVVRDGEKVGRNAPCTCGSGKKYKRCCGREK